MSPIWTPTSSEEDEEGSYAPAPLPLAGSVPPGAQETARPPVEAGPFSPGSSGSPTTAGPSGFTPRRNTLSRGNRGNRHSTSRKTRGTVQHSPRGGGLGQTRFQADDDYPVNPAEVAAIQAGRVDAVIRVNADKLRSLVMLSDPYIASDHTQHVPADSFRDCYIGVEANYYLARFVNDKRYAEPLVGALGGPPLSLMSIIETNLNEWKAAGVKPNFFFDGQSIVGEREVAFETAKAAEKKTRAAWEAYTNNHATEAVAAFGRAGVIQPKMLYPVLLEVLAARGELFSVAPGRAAAQMSHYLAQPKYQWCEAVYGSDELLLYPLTFCNGAPAPLIKDLDFKKNVASVVLKDHICEKLKVNDQILQDALLMTGTSFLPIFPGLRDTARPNDSQLSVRDSVNLLRTADHHVISACNSFGDLIKTHDPNWLDKYMQAKKAIQHSVVITPAEKSEGSGGKAIILDEDKLPKNNHEITGLRIPDELLANIQKGGISPQVADWISWQQVLLGPPLDGGDADEYRRLVTEQLIPTKEQILTLHVSRMNRAFHRREITMKVWYDDKKEVKFKPTNIDPPSLAHKVAIWNVKSETLKSLRKPDGPAPGTLTYALLALEDAAAAPKTISEISEKKTQEKKSTLPILKDFDEVMSNVMWRFLHLRGYITDEHQLSKHGVALAATLKALNPADKLEDAALLAHELLAYDILHARNLHEEWIGVPLRGSEDDKACNLLVSRVASLVKLEHKAIGYTGPLSLNLLSFYSSVAAIRENDRLLLEAVWSSMYLWGQADRSLEYKKTTEFGQKLPLYHNTNIALGIAVKTYLDDHCAPNADAEDRANLKAAYVKTLLPHSVDFTRDLDKAFRFFDAVYAGVKTLGEEEVSQEDRTTWDRADKWLSVRRD